jgi:hypothetical protein
MGEKSLTGKRNQVSVSREAMAFLPRGFRGMLDDSKPRGSPVVTAGKMDAEKVCYSRKHPWRLPRCESGERMSLKEGDRVVWLSGEKEIPAKLISLATSSGPNPVDLAMIEIAGDHRLVHASQLLAAKKSGFNLRDLALVIDENREAAEGEIVATGKGPKGQAFYQLRFQAGAGTTRSWYREDEVFLVSAARGETPDTFQQDGLADAPIYSQ